MRTMLIAMTLCAAMTLSGCSGGGGGPSHGVLSSGLQVNSWGTNDARISSFSAAYGGSDGYSVPRYFDVHFVEWHLAQAGQPANITDLGVQVEKIGQYEYDKWSFRILDAPTKEYRATAAVHETLDPSSPVIATAAGSAFYGQ